MKKDMDDLLFDNQTLKKDLAASSKMLKETQEHMGELARRDTERSKHERESREILL